MSNYILSIGISDYDYCTPLSASVADAHYIHSLFQSSLGFERGGSPLFNPRKFEVDDAIKQRLSGAGANDTIVVFIAGHGISIKGRLLLLFRSANSTALQRNSLGQEVLDIVDLLDQLLSIKGAHVLLLLDMCRSDLEIDLTRAPTPGNYLLPKQTLGSEEIKTLLDEINKTSPSTHKAQVGVMFASADGKPAYELQNQKRGVFSLGLETVIKEHQERRPSQSLSIGQKTLALLKDKMEQLSQNENEKLRDYKPSYVGTLDAVEIHKGQLIKEEKKSSKEDELKIELLRTKFENQKLKKQIDHPIGDNCIETLGALKQAGYDINELKELRATLEKAKVPAEYEKYLAELMQKTAELEQNKTILEQQKKIEQVQLQLKTEQNKSKGLNQELEQLKENMAKHYPFPITHAF